MKYFDALGAKIVINQQDTLKFIASMPTEKKRYVRFVAKTIQSPSEIWLWMQEPRSLMRTYISLYEIKEAKEVAAVVVVCQYNDEHENWNINKAEILIKSELNDFNHCVNTYRTSRLIFRASN